MTNPRRMRTEHAARIAPPSEFRPDSFRRKRIADGVSLVLGKRPGATTTETTAIRFDADVFTPTQAREWLARYGYTPIAFEAANPANIPPGPQNPSAGDVAAARLNVTEAQAHLKEALAALAREINPPLERHRYVVEWPDGTRRTVRADPDRIGFGKAKERIAQLVAPSGGKIVEATPANPENEPNPRTLVEIGKARELVFDGHRYRWPVKDDWRVLVPAGAEQLAAGSGRIFLVPPPATKSGEAPPDGGAARETFEDWHGFEPSKAYTADVPTVEEFAGGSAGKAQSIVYRSHKWSRGRMDYEHHFSRRVPPDVLILGSVEAPRAVLVRGGEFRTTARGLVD